MAYLLGLDGAVSRPNLASRQAKNGQVGLNPARIHQDPGNGQKHYSGNVRIKTGERSMSGTYDRISISHWGMFPYLIRNPEPVEPRQNAFVQSMEFVPMRADYARWPYFGREFPTQGGRYAGAK